MQKKTTTCNKANLTLLIYDEHNYEKCLTLDGRKSTFRTAIMTWAQTFLYLYKLYHHDVLGQPTDIRFIL